MRLCELELMTLPTQAPTYQLGNTLIWGQDKLNVVQDLILGWKPEHSNLKVCSSALAVSPCEADADLLFCAGFGCGVPSLRLQAVVRVH